MLKPCLGLILLAAVPATSVPAIAPPPGRSAEAEARKPVMALLDAMSRRDLAGLEQALARTVQPEIVYYWGEKVSGRDAILEWHREWFAEPGWTLETRPIEHLLVDRWLATVTATVRYRKSATRQFLIMISYALVKERDEWKIARIQQTLLEGPE